MHFLESLKVRDCMCHLILYFAPFPFLMLILFFRPHAYEFYAQLESPELQLTGPNKMGRTEYFTHLKNAKFCLAPRGESSWTLRFYESFFVVSLSLTHTHTILAHVYKEILRSMPTSIQ